MQQVQKRIVTFETKREGIRNDLETCSNHVAGGGGGEFARRLSGRSRAGFKWHGSEAAQAEVLRQRGFRCLTVADLDGGNAQDAGSERIRERRNQKGKRPGGHGE